MPQVTRLQDAAPAASCPQCIDNVPNYHHVHQAATLPRQIRSEHRIVVHGYAVGLDGGLPQTWVFFKDLEPALVFGRAGRMSNYDIAGYGVYRAAHETRFDNTAGDDIETLHLIYGGESLHHQPDEADAFQRWLRGVRRGSAYFHPGRRTSRTATIRKAGHP